MKIETERLVISEFDDSMIGSVHLNSLDEDNRRFVPDEVFETIEEAREAVEFLKTRYESSEGPFVHPILLHSGENIGHVQAVQIEGGWEIGYHIAETYTGNGYSVEAVKAFLPVLFKKLDITKIYGICLAENVASQKVLEKCGFEFDHKSIENYQNKPRLVYRYKYSLS